ncbi:MAG: hypothetical protein QOG10_5870 [Kribbellaceae bacterium]|jgi:hypothetical protein|nr:hypothetical protein [Kribbellaceae bacterium]
MPKNTQVLRNLQEYATTDAMTRREKSLVQAIQILLEAPGIDTQHRRQLVDIALWKFTEASGMQPHPKYNLRYLTDGARNLGMPADVNHEHVWPRKWILDRLMGHRRWAPQEIEELLRAHAVACVVTVEEHALLGGVRAPGWERYAAAGVTVWDRASGAYLDTGSKDPAATRRVRATSPAAPVDKYDLQVLIWEKAGKRAPYLERLTRMARFASSVAVVALRQSGEPAPYFRVHDTMIEEPTRAVAFPHWSGKVDFALVPGDVPPGVMQEPYVKELKHATYAVSCRVTDDASLGTAEELLFLALQKLRNDEVAA